MLAIPELLRMGSAAEPGSGKTILTEF